MVVVVHSGNPFACCCSIFGVITVICQLLRGCRSRSLQRIFAAGLQQSSSKRCERDLTSSLSFKLLMNLFCMLLEAPMTNGICTCSAQSLYLLWLLVSFSGHAFTGLLRRFARALSYVMQPRSPPPRHVLPLCLSFIKLWDSSL